MLRAAGVGVLTVELSSGGAAPTTGTATEARHLWAGPGDPARGGRAGPRAIGRRWWGPFAWTNYLNRPTAEKMILKSSSVK